VSRQSRVTYLASAVVLALVIAPADAGCRGAVGSVDAGTHGGDGGGSNEDAFVIEEVCTPDADDTFCPMYAEAFCTGHFACCDATDDPGTRYATMEQCVQRTTCICVAHRSGAAFDSGQVSYDETAGAALLAHIHDAAHTCSVVPPASLDVDSAFVGTLAEHASCAPSGSDYSALFACGPDLYCYVTDFGDDVTPPTADCRRYRLEGETCDASGMTCRPGLYCAAGATIDDPGICQALLADGAPCAEDFECASDYCDDTLGDTCARLGQDDTWCVDAAASP
jgi:hypothetical protein